LNFKRRSKRILKGFDEPSTSSRNVENSSLENDVENCSSENNVENSSSKNDVENSSSKNDVENSSPENDNKGKYFATNDKLKRFKSVRGDVGNKAYSLTNLLHEETEADQKISRNKDSKIILTEMARKRLKRKFSFTNSIKKLTNLVKKDLCDDDNLESDSLNTILNSPTSSDYSPTNSDNNSSSSLEDESNLKKSKTRYKKNKVICRKINFFFVKGVQLTKIVVTTVNT